jgi:hypothetical protein
MDIVLLRGSPAGLLQVDFYKPGANWQLKATLVLPYGVKQAQNGVLSPLA